MGFVKNDMASESKQLFNSPLETGVRSLIILNEAFPKSFDLTTLTWLDHLVVHTADINGPESLHPDVPQRGGEILVRRRLIENSLTLMRRVGLITVIHTHNGVEYQAKEEAYPLVQLMRTRYSKDLKQRAKWLVENICKLETSDFKKLVTKTQGRWDVEFLKTNKGMRGK